MRTCHYWKKAGRAQAPANIIVFDTETVHGKAAEVEGGELQTLRIGVALAYRLEAGKRTRVAELVFRTPGEFWKFVRSRLDKKRPVWLVAHNIGYDLGVVGGWGIITSDAVSVKKACISNSLFYLKGFLDGCPVCMVDTFNYYRCSLKVIGKSLGFPKLDMPDVATDDDTWIGYCRRDVEVTALALDSLIRFIRTEKLGPWQASVAGLAFSAFRSRFMEAKVLVHVNPNALRIEREAYYGGIVDTAHVGRVPAKAIYELDVCSMYPAVCREPLPVRLKGWSPKVGPDLAKKLMKDYMMVADVTLESHDVSYPVRLPTGTYYPTGRYRTCLAHPELEEAFKAGHVKWWHSASWYEAEPILRKYMEYFVGKKSAYRAEGNEAWATLAKYYANNLYGKTGQETPIWREWDKDAMRELEERHRLPEGALYEYYDKPPTLYELEETVHVQGIAEPLEVRDYYGVVEVRVGSAESRESCPAIAATVTSYARQLLRSYQATAGRGHWYYCDTDSIWVDIEGRARLEAAGCVADEQLGYLSVKSEHQWMIVHGPKDYETDKVRRMKGVRVTAEPTDDGGWSQLQFPSPIVQIGDGYPAGVYVRRITKHLKRDIKKCRVLQGGVTRPLAFPGERPAK